MPLIPQIPQLSLSYPWSMSYMSGLKEYEDKIVSVANRVIDIKVHFGAAGDGTTNDADAFNSAWDYLASVGGGRLYMPRGVYRMDSMLKPTASSGISIFGDGDLRQSVIGGVTVIVGDHNQDAILNLQGSVHCCVSDLKLIAGESVPKAGLVLGRSVGGGSAGWHSFNRVAIQGAFSVAALYNVASECNSYRDMTINVLNGGAANMAVYLTGGDSAGLSPATPLVGSTMLGAAFYNCFINHFGTDVDSSAIHIDGSVATGGIAFRDGYLTQNNGSYVTITTGGVDSGDTFGPIIFDGVGGEPMPGNHPAAGFRLIGSAISPSYLRGLRISQCPFSFYDGAGKYILQDQLVKLAGAHIHSYGIDRTGGTTLALVSSTIGSLKTGSGPVQPGENLNCYIDVGNGVISPS